MENNKRFVSTFLIFSAGYIALGFLLILAPDTIQQIIGYFLGGLAIVAGLIRMALYVRKDDLSRAFRNDLAIGVVLIVAGIYLIINPDNIWKLIPLFLGFAIVFDSIIKMQHAFDLKRTGFGFWWVILIAALTTAILGVMLIMFGPDVLLFFFGVVLIGDGIINIISILLVYFRQRAIAKGKINPNEARIRELPMDEESNDAAVDAAGDDSNSSTPQE